MTPAEMLATAQETARLTTQAQRAFGRRIIAVVIDVLVLSLVTFFINGVFGVTHVTSGSVTPPPGSSLAMFTSTTDVGWSWLTLVWLAYYLGLEALFGATAGKWASRLRVTDHVGQRPLLRQIVVRNVVRVVDALPVGYLIGGSVAMVSPLRQRIGDHLANTAVLPQETLAAPLLTPAQLRRRLALAGGVILVSLGFSAIFFYYGRPPLVVQGMVNTRQMIFRDGVSSYALSAPMWGSDTVTYQIEYVTEQPTDTCHAHLTLAWTFPTGWEPRYGDASCDMHTP